MNILISGGARSGKSRFAESLYPNQDVTYVCTYVNDLQDIEMLSRIHKHQQQRSAMWHTVEVNTSLDVSSEYVLLDCISVFVSNVLYLYSKDIIYIDDLIINQVEQHLHLELTRLLAQSSHIIFVTNEVGSSLVPQSHLERVYRDILGRINCWLAERVNVVYLVVCGQPLKIKEEKHNED